MSAISQSLSKYCDVLIMSKSGTSIEAFDPNYYINTGDKSLMGCSFIVASMQTDCVYVTVMTSRLCLGGVRIGICDKCRSDNAISYIIFTVVFWL